jgi:hypothetical protein
MDTTIHNILQEFRDAATSNRDMGDKFERLMRSFLQTDCPCGFSVASPYPMTTCWHCGRDTLVTIPEDDFFLNQIHKYVVFEYQRGEHKQTYQNGAGI